MCTEPVIPVWLCAGNLAWIDRIGQTDNLTASRAEFHHGSGPLLGVDRVHESVK